MNRKVVRFAGVFLGIRFEVCSLHRIHSVSLMNHVVTLISDLSLLPCSCIFCPCVRHEYACWWGHVYFGSLQAGRLIYPEGILHGVGVTLDEHNVTLGYLFLKP